MRLHHLDAGPLRVPGASMVCRVLVIELPDRLVLVDSGFSAADVADPSRLGPSRWFLRPDLRIERTVRAQLAARGLDPETVGDVVLTHADVDHASGIRDFPAARIHLAAAEHRAWAARRTLLEADPARAGGHSFTYQPADPALPAVDLGFQVFNLTTYPHLVQFFRALGVVSARRAGRSLARSAAGTDAPPAPGLRAVRDDLQPFPQRRRG